MGVNEAEIMVATRIGRLFLAQVGFYPGIGRSHRAKRRWSQTARPPTPALY
jgi:hypothetical protein